MRLSREPAARRRLAALCAAAALAAALGAVLGSSTGSDQPTPKPRAREVPPRGRPSTGRADPAARLPLERQVGQLALMGFDGTAAPEYIRRRLRSGEGAGAVVFAKNAPEPTSTRDLMRSLQRAAGGGALVATDQEGGSGRSLAFAPPGPSQSALASPAAAAGAARTAARGLRGVGVNVNLAPVADVASATGSVVGGRAYPGDPLEVATLVRASVRAYAPERVGSTVKHFPGFGRATANTDDAPVTIGASRAALASGDLRPFREAVRAGTPLVMASHALYPALDRRRIASQSPGILGDLLRRRLGFHGVVLTDSIEAQAVLARSDVGTAAERSVAAGADLVLMTGSGSWNLVYPRLLARARRDSAFRARVRESARRVLALKRRLGLRAASS